MIALADLGDKIRGLLNGGVVEPTSNMHLEVMDPNTREIMQVSQVVQCQNFDGSNYIRPRSNGNLCEFYRATYVAYMPGQTLFLDDFKHVYFQVPQGTMITDDLLKAIAERSKNLEVERSNDVAKNIGIFEFDLRAKSWHTNQIHYFKDADRDFVIPENGARNIEIAKSNASYKQTLYQQAGEQAGRIIANDAIRAGVYQNERPKNLAEKWFDYVGPKGNIQRYSGVVCMDPNWTPANTNDRLTGEEFTFECTNVTQRGDYYEYSGYAGIKPPYEQFRDNWPLVTFRTNVDLKALTSQGVPDILMKDGAPHSSFTNYPPNQEGANAVIKLFSQQEIYYGTQNQLFLGELQKLPNGKVEAILNLSRINEDPQY